MVQDVTFARRTIGTHLEGIMGAQDSERIVTSIIDSTKEAILALNALAAAVGEPDDEASNESARAAIRSEVDAYFEALDDALGRG